MRSVFVTYASGLAKFSTTVRTMCPEARVRGYVVRRLQGSDGCMSCGSVGTLVTSLGTMCNTVSRRSTLSTLRVFTRR